jgi:hypothetical protein
MNNIVPLKEATINLANLWAFNTLRKESAKRKAEYLKLLEGMHLICEIYADKFPDILDKIKEIRLDIRLITRGTPVTEPMLDADEPIFTDSHSQQLYDAESALLKQAYKKAAQTTHPDRLGGNSDLFDLVNKAYKARDLAELTELYLFAVNKANLWWQQSTEAVLYATMEMERPRTQLNQLKATPLFKVSRYHTVGRFDLAEEAMQQHLLNEVSRLVGELNFLRSKQNGNKNQEVRETSSQGNREEVVSVGESAPS